MEEKNRPDGVPEGTEVPETVEVSETPEVIETPEVTETVEAIETAEPVSDAPVYAYTPDGAGEAVLPAPNKNRTPLVIGISAVCVLLVAVVVGITLVTSGIFLPPREAIGKAFSVTGERRAERSEQLMKEVPGYGMLWDTPDNATKDDFNVVIDRVEFGNDPFTNEMFSKILNGFGVKGTVMSDPENTAGEVDMSLQMSGLDLLQFYLYASPDKLAFNVPTFSDTALAFSPATFAEDAQNSPLYRLMGLNAEALDMLQQQFDAQFGALDDMSEENADRMAAEMEKIFAIALENAVFEKLPKEDGLRCYGVTLDGERVKAMVLRLVEYVYLESPVAASMTSSFPPAYMMNGMTYEDMVREMILTPLEQGMPALATDVVVKVGKDNVIRSVQETMQPFTVMGYNFDAFTSELKIGEDLSQEMTIACRASSPYGEQMDFNISVNDTYQDGKLDQSFVFGMMSPDVMEMNMNIALASKMDKAGACDMRMQMDMTDPNMGESVQVELFAVGTVAKAADATVYTFPELGLTMNMYDQPINFNCKLDAKSTPIADGWQPSHPSKEVFKLSEAELTAELSKYETGMDELSESLYSVIAGASPFGGT